MNSDNNEKTEYVEDGGKVVGSIPVEEKHEFDDSVDEKFDINAKRNELLKKVEKLEFPNVEFAFSEQDVIASAFPESLKIEEEKERIKFERRSLLRSYKRTELLLNDALAAEKKRESLERNLVQIEKKLDKERDSLAVQFELDKAGVQKKIDALKQEMFEFGKSIQEKEITSEDALVDKSNKEQWFSFILRNKKRLPVEKNETLTAMIDRMQSYNAEIEELHMKFNKQVAVNLAQFEQAKEQVKKAKQDESFKKKVVKAWVSGQEEKKRPVRQAVTDGVKEIVELNSDSETQDVKLTRRQRVVAALRQIYHFLCKKLSGIKRERARQTGKRAIEKEMQGDRSLNRSVNVKSTPTS